jgi:spermidine synthase
MAGHDWIGTAFVPDGEELRLMQSGDEFTILLRDNELMSTRASTSEEALATLTHARLGTRAEAEWLIGGYGLGFTLRAALAVLESDARVTVAEIVPEIIAWAHGPMAELTAGCLDDPRVTLVDNDVALLIHAASGGYDAILLDVDNGPEGLTSLRNDQLYDRRGLDLAMAALRSRGILAVWSAYADPTFTALLQDGGFEVEVVTVQEIGGEPDEKYVIWFAQKP